MAHSAVTVYQDDSGTTKWSYGGRPGNFYPRDNIDIRQTFITDMMNEGSIMVTMIAINEKLADLSTKPFGDRSLSPSSRNVQYVVD